MRIEQWLNQCKNMMISDEGTGLQASFIGEKGFLRMLC